MLSSGGRIPDIGVRGLTKRYGGVTALNDVDLDVGGGEFMTLLGPSGSGKSTLLMVLAGFIRPDQGDVILGGKSVVRVPPHRRNIGMVFQKHALFPHMSVFDNIAYPLRLRRVGASSIRERVDEVLALVRLEGYGARRIDQLSGGQSQRVALARAIVFSPSIMLMDEPLSALDKNLREQMQIEIRALHDKLGLTTVYVTHDQREALTMSDRIAVMTEGAIAQVGTPQRIYGRPADAFVAAFIGETTLAPVERGPDGPVVLGANLAEAALPAAAGSRLFLVLRPGMVEICPDDERPRDYVYLSGSVVRPIYEGDSTLYQVDCGSGVVLSTRQLVRAARAGCELASGDTVSLRLHRRDLLIVPEAAA